MMFTKMVSLLVILLGSLLVGGCSVNPTYEVRVINDSRSTLMVRIEHRPKFASPIILDSVEVKAGEERSLGPVESAPMERVVLLVGRASEMQSSPQRFIIRRGSYVARITRGASTSWSPYQVDLSKE